MCQSIIEINKVAFEMGLSYHWPGHQTFTDEPPHWQWVGLGGDGYLGMERRNLTQFLGNRDLRFLHQFVVSQLHASVVSSILALCNSQDKTPVICGKNGLSIYGRVYAVDYCQYASYILESMVLFGKPENIYQIILSSVWMWKVFSAF